jgi:hypothetical protein
LFSEQSETRCFIIIALEYAIKVRENQEALEVNGTHHLLVCIDNVNMLGKSTNTIEKKHRGSVKRLVGKLV